MGFKENEKKLFWVKWNKVLAEKNSGGLGVGSIQAQNLALLRKWKWRFYNKSNSMWNKVIKELYGAEEGFDSLDDIGSKSGVWVDILRSCKHIEKIGVPFHNSIIRQVPSGNQTLFWKVPWNSSGRTMQELFP